MSEAAIKELTEEMLDQVITEHLDDETKSDDPPKPPAEKNVEIKYKAASEGDRERPWVISNKMVTIGELEGKRLPLKNYTKS